MESEIFKDIPEYEGLYQASSLGRIKSQKRIRRLRINRYGYCIVLLSKNGIVKSYQAHRLIAKTFLSTFISNLQVNHKNGIRNDNRIENLEMVTASENQRHSYRVLGRKPAVQKKSDQTKRKIWFYEDDIVNLSAEELFEFINKKIPLKVNSS